ncbi:hypothetical protein [Mucilaginibacter arboris]|uniref:Uncharacterized protein n=1 Tax=Mucilaginibacter arboris TaxID=2682090 RepID=A0A7K1SY04_9SPHI|nr:hypothetical protein [Mucilaginibacter arboris]MVN22211.1 hypothetical protein [Mucilaginibacter arboris]
MKKIISNLNLYILLLAPVFLIALVGIVYHSINVNLPDVQTEITGLFNKRTIFQILCEVVKEQIW